LSCESSSMAAFFGVGGLSIAYNIGLLLPLYDLLPLLRAD
jgi:hypothetical protein